MKPAQSITLRPELQTYIGQRQHEFALIPAGRQRELREVADYVRKRIATGDTARLIFICTHNSRRSHLAQVWATVAADVYGVRPVETYSGGTEATAFNPRAVAALRRSGLRIEIADDDATTNPVYWVSHADGIPAQECYSKIFDQPPNPDTAYCAVMTCSQADEACPLVPGCDLRAPIRYEDPKVSDDTPEEAATYDERSGQICREMLFMMSAV